MKMSVFQSTAWQQSWWNVWGQTRGFRLLTEGEGSVSGLYIDRYNFKGILPIRCLQFVGTNYRRILTPRTEYNSLSEGSNPNYGGWSHLTSCSWTEAVFRDLREPSFDLFELKKLSASKGWLWRILDEDIAYSIDTSGSWDAYLKSLGSSTRLRLFNRRKVLDGLGRITLERAGRDDFFQLLNKFHVARWGRRCFSEKSLAFHKEFLAKLVFEGGSPELSVLYCDGRPISVLYNVTFQGCVYNIQSGFETGLHKKLAVGTLHLGYVIEDAFRRPDVRKFDLLAGTGKHEDYKVRLATDSEKLLSVMLVRSPIFKMLYQLKG
jgi:GNAT acetyltransferase-like protein